MKIKKLMPMDAESRRLIDWMEKGKLIIRLEAHSEEIFAPDLLLMIFLYMFRCL